jgi:hypothetical protein
LLAAPLQALIASGSDRSALPATGTESPSSFRAPHRRLRCIGNPFCMGLILQFRVIRTPLNPDCADHGLPARIDVDALHDPLLLAFAAVAFERFEQRGESAGELGAWARFSRRPSKVCSPIMPRR